MSYRPLTDMWFRARALDVKARQVAAFLRENGIEFESEFATTRSGLIIYDIGLRMLQPRELFNA